jgi:hypothetical protein
MSFAFGPWSTSMSTGIHVELNTFWRRRMAMLPQIARLNSPLSRRSRWSLVLGAIALLALPTWCVNAQSPDEKPESKALPAPRPAAAAAVEPTLSPVAAKPAAGAGQSRPPVVEFLPQYSAQEQQIELELEKNTSLDFTDESLDGVRDTIMERHGFNIIIEKRLLEEDSVATDATDINLKVSEIPLRSALKLLLQPKGLTFVVEDSVLKITTGPAHFSQYLTRTYPVRDLIGDDTADFKLLMEAIKLGVTPGAWVDGISTGQEKPAKRSDSVATISMVPASGSLVIRQNWEGHEEVLKLLRALRQAKVESSKRSEVVPPPIGPFSS